METTTSSDDAPASEKVESTLSTSSTAVLNDAESRSGYPDTRGIIGGAFVMMHQYAMTAGTIPSEDYDYHSAFPTFNQHVEQQSTALVEIMEQCFRVLPRSRRPTLRLSSSSNTTANKNGHGEGELNVLPLPSRLGELERTVVMEAIDSMLENIDVVLDEVKGKKLRANDQLQLTFGSELIPIGGSDARSYRSLDHMKEGSSLSNPRNRVFTVNTSSGMAHVSRVIRPQLIFKNPVDNSVAASFLPHYADELGVVHIGRAGEHPFEAVIKSFQPPASQLLPKVDVPPLPLDQCPLVFVDTVESMKKLVQELSHAQEIAVDLEHHDFYSFLGFTCLVQISTRVTDYIIDCLKLRDEMKLLAPVLLNPKILKVFHGAREDVRWLQKDFSLYLVNFFDTGIALQTLHMPYSLSFAVDHFCQVKLEKKYQTADWRVRPIPSEMVHYARQDTHYLLYIYDRLKSMLLNAESHSTLGNLLLHVYQASKILSLEKYEKPTFDPEYSYIRSLDRSLAGLNTIQRKVAQYLYNWRDAAAREVDDSPVAVLHQSSLLSISSKLPQTAREVLQCAHPISATFRGQAAKIAEVIRAFAEDAHQQASAESRISSSRPFSPSSIPNPERSEGNGSTALSSTRTSSTTHLLGAPLGVFRPMTGTFPSISMPPLLHPTFVATTTIPFLSMPTNPSSSTSMVQDNGSKMEGSENEESSAHLRAKLDCSLPFSPSKWILKMRDVSRCLASRPRPCVPLPGAHILEVIAQRYQKVKVDEEAAKRRKLESSTKNDVESDEEGEEQLKEVSDFTADADKVLPSSSTGSIPSIAEASSSNSINTIEEDGKMKSESSPEGPFSMRQTLGIGAKNRRDAKRKKKG